MRVLHATSSLDPRAGGPIAVLAGLATAQARAGNTVTILSTHRTPTPPPIDALERAGVTVTLVGPTRGRLERHADLRAAANRLVATADVVHVHALWEDVQHQVARAAQRQNVPYVVTPHGMLTPWSLAQSKWPKRLFLALRVRPNLQRAAAIHFTTTQERDDTAASNLHLLAKTIVEPPGVDFAEFEHLPSPGSFRAQHPALQGRPLIVFLGRIHPGKGLEYLVPALALLPDAALAIVGPDSENYRATIERLVDHRAVRDRVIFTGLLAGPARVAALADADLFCLPSDHENFGMAVVESLAAGTPALLSDRVAIAAELTAAGVATTAPREPAALARELHRWLTDPTLRRDAAAKSRPFVRQRYDWTQIAARWQQHYTALRA